jgi:hypothetical protein
MVRSLRPVLFVLALVLLPAAAFAQVGSIAGTVKDSAGGVLPGVTVEVTSPQLIEKVRTTVTDGNGRYQIVSLPVGTYKVTFKLENFSSVERTNVELTSDYTAPVNVELKPGARSETVTVVGTSAPLVDVQNARQRQVFTGEEIRDLPTTGDLPGIVNLVPGISLSAAGGQNFDSNSVPNICEGGAGGFTPGGVFGNAFSFSATGGQSGCSPILGAFNGHSSMNQPGDLDRGRIQVDGMGIQSSFGGGRTSYIPDVTNAQEVTFTLSGGLGETETGGTTINIVPRTGGNRYAGNYRLTYGDAKMYDRNQGTRTQSQGRSFNLTNQLDHDYDNNLSYGGPIIKNRLWFQSAWQNRGRQTNPALTYYNLNEGVFGANYQPDLSRPINSDEQYRHINTRLTLQATQKNKINLFWDEQYTCEYPCHGIQNSATSPEAQATSLTYPLHVAQVSWTNPVTNKILFDAGGSWYSSHVNQTRNRFLPLYNSIPRVTESGNTTYRTSGSTTGSINNGTYFNNDNFQFRASASYVTGSHNAKIGYDGKVMSSFQRPSFNDLQLSYAYTTPASTCTSGLTPPATGTWCGLVGPGVPGLAPGTPNPSSSPYAVSQATCLDNDGNVVCRWPVPTSITEYLPNKLDQSVFSNSFYVQDQWTLNRFTLNGALRYDNAISSYGETCVGPDLYLTDRQYCVNVPGSGAGKDGKGVSFQDLTPRWGVAWDVFGNGKTSIKWNMGKYVAGAGITGIYTAANAAGFGRTVNSITRGWTDTNGDRIANCDLTVPAVAPASTATTIPASGECAAITAFTNSTISDYRRFGRSPDELDEANQAIGLSTIQCGRNDSSRIDQRVIDYCADYFNHGGADMLHGWGKRQYEWQFGLGVQHELLPRMSVEVTYNRRDSYLQTISDGVGVGCDLYNNANGSPDQCMAAFQNWSNPQYDFFAVQAPVDSRFPQGGGYLVPGFLDRKPTTAAAAAVQVTGQTLDIDHRLKSYWRGVDVNVTMRARGGVRISGGTSTGAQYVNSCSALVDTVGQSGVILRADGTLACENDRPFQTNVRGTASYTIPWIDVLFSSTFSYRPGVQIQANYTYNLTDLQWMAGSEYRATNTQGCSTAVPVGCLVSSNTVSTFTTNLLPIDNYGEGIRLFDIKLAKNIRFARKRLNLGMDVYNVFNSDAALQYCSTYTGCANTSIGTVPWRTVTGLTTPRYARFQMQFDF